MICHSLNGNFLSNISALRKQISGFLWRLTILFMVLHENRLFLAVKSCCLDENLYRLTMLLSVQIFSLLLLNYPVEVISETKLSPFLKGFEDCSFTYFSPLSYYAERITRFTPVEYRRVVCLRIHKYLKRLEVSFSFQPSGENFSVPLATRLTLCSVRIIFFFEMSILQIAEREVSSPQTHYLWILTVNKNFAGISRHNLLYLYQVPNIKFIAIKDYQTAYLICRHCRAHTVNVTSNSSRAEIQRMWNIMHKDMNQGEISQIDGFTFVKGQLNKRHRNHSICIPFRNSPYLSPEHCRSVVLCQHHNLSIVFTKRPTSKSVSYLRPTFSIPRILAVARNHLLVSPYSLSSSHYSFFTILKDFSGVRTKQRVDGLLKPLSWDIWLLMTTSSMLVAFLLTYKDMKRRDNSKRAESLSESFWKCWIALINLLIGQPPIATCAVDRLQNLKLMVLWFLWTLVVLLASQTYQAVLFSSLTYGVDPSLPISLEDLIRRKFMILTSEICYSIEKFNEEEKVRSCLKDRVLPAILKAKVKSTINYTAIHEKVVWSRVSPTETIVYDGLAKGRIALTKGESISCPPAFAIMDDAMFAAGMPTLFKDLDVGIMERNWVSTEYRTPSLDYRRYDLVCSNSFYPVVNRVFAAVEESGLYNRIQRHWSGMFKLYRVKRLLKKNPHLLGNAFHIDEKMDAFIKEKGLRAKYLHQLSDFTKKIFGLAEIEFSPLTKEIHFRVMVYWAFGVGVTILSLLLEFIVSHYNNFSNRITESSPSANISE